MNQKKLYVIAGCNGAGKTTASFNILPEILECKEFVNADEIARGLSPFRPEQVAIAAGRMMLTRIQELIFYENDKFEFLKNCGYDNWWEETFEWNCQKGDEIVFPNVNWKKNVLWVNRLSLVRTEKLKGWSLKELFSFQIII